MNDHNKTYIQLLSLSKCGKQCKQCTAMQKDSPAASAWPCMQWHASTRTHKDSKLVSFGRQKCMGDSRPPQPWCRMKDSLEATLSICCKTASTIQPTLLIISRCIEAGAMISYPKLRLYRSPLYQLQSCQRSQRRSPEVCGLHKQQSGRLSK